ncbi:hypothetical protein O3G_MSEX000691 [Manduca sexta]|nr:hypothetical protein O3G_MSEX000691 [Manduca sexta]
MKMNCLFVLGAESRGGSKRYSSLRQRPLGDSYTPQPQAQQQQAQPAQPQQQQQQQQHRYHNGPGEYTGAAPPHQGSPAAHPPHLMHQVCLQFNSTSPVLCRRLKGSIFLFPDLFSLTQHYGRWYWVTHISILL